MTNQYTKYLCKGFVGNGTSCIAETTTPEVTTPTTAITTSSTTTSITTTTYMNTTNSTPSTTTMTNRCAEGYVEESIDPSYEGYMCLNIDATIKTPLTTSMSPCNCSCPPTATLPPPTNVTYSLPFTTSNSIITFISGLLISIILSI